MDTRRRNPELLAAQIQISIPNKYLGCGYKGLGCFQLANIFKGRYRSHRSHDLL